VISIDVTDVVRRWADGSLADGGFLLVTTDAIKAYFDAKEQPGGLAATLEVDTGPPAYSGEAIVLDLSNADNCIIDEPGYYVLDRSWLLTMENQEKPNGSCPADVHITSGGVPSRPLSPRIAMASPSTGFVPEARCCSTTGS
jgi:hypothetical protein